MTLDLDIGQSKKPKILMKNSIVYYEADTNSLVDTDTLYENFTINIHLKKFLPS